MTFLAGLIKNLTLPNIMAISIMLGFFFFLNKLLYTEVPEKNLQIVVSLITTIAASLGTIVGYQWGSSSGSAKKTQMLKPDEKPKEPTE